MKSHYTVSRKAMLLLILSSVHNDNSVLRTLSHYLFHQCIDYVVNCACG